MAAPAPAPALAPAPAPLSVRFALVDAIRLLTVGTGFQRSLPDRQAVLLWLQFGAELRMATLPRAAIEAFEHEVQSIITRSDNVPDDLKNRLWAARMHSRAALQYATDDVDGVVDAPTSLLQRIARWTRDQYNFLALRADLTRQLTEHRRPDVSVRQHDTIVTRVTDLLRRWDMSSTEVRVLDEYINGGASARASLMRAIEWGEAPLYHAATRYTTSQLEQALHDDPPMTDAIQTAVRRVIDARAAVAAAAARVPAAAAASFPVPILPLMPSDALLARRAQRRARDIASEVIEILDDPAAFGSLAAASAAALECASKRFRS